MTDTPVRSRERVVLEQQEHRLAVVVEPLLEVREAELQLGLLALERHRQHVGVECVNPAHNGVPHGANGRDVEAKHQRLVAPEPCLKGALRSYGDLRVFVAVPGDRLLDQSYVTPRLLIAAGQHPPQLAVSEEFIGTTKICSEACRTVPFLMFLHGSHHQIVHQFRVSTHVQTGSPAERGSAHATLR